MNDYGKSAALSAATILPATSAQFLADGTHPLILAGLFGISLISLITLTAYISRYLINKKG